MKEIVDRPNLGNIVEIRKRKSVIGFMEKIPKGHSGVR
jgi:hypothetical protein